MLPVADAPMSTRPEVVLSLGKSVSASEFPFAPSSITDQGVGAHITSGETYYLHVVGAVHRGRVDHPAVVAHARVSVRRKVSCGRIAKRYGRVRQGAADGGRVIDRTDYYVDFPFGAAGLLADSIRRHDIHGTGGLDARAAA